MSTEACALGDSIFLPLSLPSRPAFGPADLRAAARPLPSAPPAASGPNRSWASEARCLRLPRLGVLNPLPPARSQVPEPCGCRVPTDAPRTAHLPVHPVPEPTRPPCVLLQQLGCSLVSLSLIIAAACPRRRRVAQAALLWLRAEGPLSCRELPLLELLAPRRRPSGRGNARSPPPPGPAAPPNSRQGIARDPTGAAPNGGRKIHEILHQIVFLQLGSHSSAVRLCALRDLKGTET